MVLMLLSLSLQAVAASQNTPQELGELWVASIRSSSTDKIKTLIHPNCPKSSVSDQLLKRMVAGPMPNRFTIETLDLGEKDVLRKIYAVLPEKQLNLKYVNHGFEDQKKFGLGKGFPISRIDGKWYFVVCTKTKPSP